METDIKARINRFLASENLSPTRFADEIGVQRSSISHILSGRNNPSYEFIQKILSRYRQVNPEWLILGSGNMLKTIRQGELFQMNEILPPTPQPEPQKMEPEKVKVDEKSTDNTENELVNSIIASGKNSVVLERIVLFYSDNTFKTYIPSQND
jgi:transcriptional regulator with XRE-family HTH domain